MPEASRASPYPGTAPFQDRAEDRAFFFGRERDLRALTTMVLSEPHALLFARSGVGKSSLINAGLLEELRKQGNFPVSARLTHNSAGMVQSILERVREEAARQGFELKGDATASDLWGFFHHVRFFKDGTEAAPILVLDQFEELFTLFDKDKRADFIGQLSDLATGRVPAKVRGAALEKLDQTDANAPNRQALVDLAYGKVILDIKILISMREDFLAEMETLKVAMPGIFRTTLRLSPLGREQAKEAIVKPSEKANLPGGNAFHFESGVPDAMLDFLSGQQLGGVAVRSDDIEPMQLQILCRSLLERVLKENRDTITLKDLGGEKGMRRVIQGYYYGILKHFPLLRPGWNVRKLRPALSNLYLFNFPRYAIRQLCENGLILLNGFRNSLEELQIAKDYGVPKGDLEVLTRDRLLRAEPRLGGTFYELSHDSLTSPLLESKQLRRNAIRGTFVGLVVATPLAIAAYGQIDHYIANYQIQQLITQASDKKASFAARRAANDELTKRANASGVIVTTRNFDKFAGEKLDLRGAQIVDSSFVGIETDIYLDGARIRDTKFNRSQIASGSFSGASLTQVDFSNADLSHAVFVGARLNDVNFSNANVTDAEFRNTVLNGAVFKGSAWWMASGWSADQVTTLQRNFPHTDYEQTDAYKEGLKKLQDILDNARKEGNSTAIATALNELSWYRVSNGLQLTQADQEINEALQLQPNRDIYLDTLAYIRMQQGKFVEARDMLAKALKADNSIVKDAKNNDAWQNLIARSNVAILYKYAVTLQATGETERAEAFFKEQRVERFKPTHELAFVPRRKNPSATRVD